MADLLPSTPDLSAAQDAEPRVIGVDSDEADELLSALASDTARSLLAALHEEPANPAALAERADTSLQNAQYHLSNLEDAGIIEVVDTAYSEKGREMNVYAPADQPLVVYAGKEEETTGLRAALSRLLGAVAALALSSVVVQSLFTGPLRGVFDLGGPPGAAMDTDTPSPTSEPGVMGEDGATATETAVDATSTPEPTMATDTPTPAAQGTPKPGATGTPTEAPAGTGTPTATPVSTETPAATGTPTPTDAGGAALDGAATATPTPVAMASGVEPGLLFFAGGLLVLSLVALWYWRRP